MSKKIIENLENNYIKFLKLKNINELNEKLNILDIFTKEFLKKELDNIDIDKFVVGKSESFCYNLEYGKAKDLGSIKGGSALKYSLYYSPSRERYIYDESLFTSKEEAIEKIRKELSIIAYSKNFNEIEKLSFIKNMFRRKVFYMYNSEKIIPIFSNSTLNDIYKSIFLEEDEYINMQNKLLNIYENINDKNKNTFNFMVFLFKYSEDKDFISEEEEDISTDLMINDVSVKTEILSLGDMELISKKNEEERKQIDFNSNLEMKKISFKIVVGLMGIEILLVFIIFFLVGIQTLSFSDNTLNIFIGSTISQISIIFYWIIKNLFSNN